MELLVIILVLVGLGLAGYFWFNRTRSSPLGQRTETYLRSEHPQTPSNAPREATVETLAPGDAVSFWDGEDALVETVIDCEEQVGAAAHALALESLPRRSHAGDRTGRQRAVHEQRSLLPG